MANTFRLKHLNLPYNRLGLMTRDEPNIPNEDLVWWTRFHKLDLINNQIKAATIDPKKTTVIAIINFIFKLSNISWAVSVFLLFFVIYFFDLPEFQMRKLNKMLRPESTKKIATGLMKCARFYCLSKQSKDRLPTKKHVNYHIILRLEGSQVD